MPSIKPIPTEREIILCLPISDEMRGELVATYEQADDTLRFELSHLLWDALWEYHEILTSEYFEILLDRVQVGELALTDDLYQNARKDVWNHLEKIWSGIPTESQLLMQARQQLGIVLT